MSIRLETVFPLVILRSPASGGATKNLVVGEAAEILHGVYPEFAEGLRMTIRAFRMDINSLQQCWTFPVELVSSCCVRESEE